MEYSLQYGINGKPLQATRQALILEKLYNGEELSISALAIEFGVSEKSVQRDFEKLKMMHPEMIERAGDNKKYRKKLDFIAKNDDEVILEMLDSLARDIGGNFYTKSHKLLSNLHQQNSTPFYSNIGVEDISTHLSIIALLEKAIFNKQKITINYKSLYEDNPSTRESISPLKILIHEGYWYLLAYHNNYFKKYYIKEIKTCDILEDHFVIPKELSENIEDALNIWFNPQKEKQEVRLWAEENIVVYLERKPIANSQKLYKQHGGAELVLKISNEAEIFPILKYWLPDLRIIEPQELQVKGTSKNHF